MQGGIFDVGMGTRGVWECDGRCWKFGDTECLQGCAWSLGWDRGTDVWEGAGGPWGWVIRGVCAGVVEVWGNAGTQGISVGVPGYSEVVGVGATGQGYPGCRRGLGALGHCGGWGVGMWGGQGALGIPLPLTLPAPFPTQVAVIAGNFELGELIKSHRDSDVGESGPSTCGTRGLTCRMGVPSLWGTT